MGKSEIKMETKERILVKAKELFMRYGIRSVTMDEVAGQCGISKKTIYQFFDDKDSLVETMMSGEVNNSENKCIIKQTQSKNAVHEVLMGDQMAMEIFEQMNPVVMYDLQKYYPKAYKILDGHKRQFMYQEVLKNLQRGIQEGVYRSDFNTDIVSKLRMEAIMMPFNHEMFPPSKYSMSEVMKALTDHFLYAIANAKGQKMIEKYKLTENAKYV